VTAERRAGPSASYLDPATVDEVEVIRGPGSVAYGSDAFGGVLRLRTRVPGIGEPTSLRYSLLGGSNDRLRAADVELGSSALGGGLLLGASWREADDYESAEAEVPNSGYETRLPPRLSGCSERRGPPDLRTDQARDVASRTPAP
jgi:outer membrane receptor protein involved in Fe transport